MTLRKRIKTRILSSARRLGFIKKKISPEFTRLQIKSAINPDGNRFDHSDFVFAKQHLRGIHKKTTQQQQACYYDFINHTCRCGLTIDKMRSGETCVLNKSKNSI
jgi:hypothetical protein